MLSDGTGVGLLVFHPINTFFEALDFSVWDLLSEDKTFIIKIWTNVFASDENITQPAKCKLPDGTNLDNIPTDNLSASLLSMLLAVSAAKEKVPNKKYMLKHI